MIINPIQAEETKKKFNIRTSIFEDINITEIRGERSSGKTKLMIDSFIYDFTSSFAEETFNSCIIAPNQRVADYFLTTINNILFPIYANDEKTLEKVTKILSGRILTTSTITRGDLISLINIEEVYVDPADWMSIVDILAIMEKLKHTQVKNIYFFRNC